MDQKCTLVDGKDSILNKYEMLKKVLNVILEELNG